MSSYHITLKQGTQLMRLAYHRLQIPEKVGEDRKFSPTQRATIQRKVRALWKALKNLSPIWLEEELLYFGPREHWIRKERTAEELDRLEKMGVTVADLVDRVSYEAKNWSTRIEVNLNGDAKEGLYWILFFWCHPESTYCITPGAQDELAWPLAAEIKRTRALEEMVGITKNDTIEVKDDEAYEKTEKEAKPTTTD